MLASGWTNRAWQAPRHDGESDGAYRDRIDRLYLDEQLVQNEEWWRRLGCPVDLVDARVLDFGCGHGALSVDALRCGAREVVGIDLDRRRVEFARRNLRDRHPDLEGRARFMVEDVNTLGPDASFDVVISKDTLEHIDRPREIFASFARLLRPGGLLVVGFSPLYHSPFGDHRRLGLPLPWIHAFLPRRVAFSWSNRIRKREVARLEEIGLNGLTPRQFRALVGRPLWQPETLRYNCGDKPLMGVFRALRRLPPAEKFFTINIYATIRRTAVA